MRKLMTMIVGVAALSGMTAFAQPTGTTPPMPPPLVPPMRGVNADQQYIMGAHRDAEVIHRALAESRHDPETLQLLTQALTDHTTLLQSELDRVTKLQALVTAIQGGDEAAIKAAREALKTSTETVLANAKTFSKDCRAIREHLIQVHQGQHTPPIPGVTPPAAPANP